MDKEQPMNADQCAKHFPFLDRTDCNRLNIILPTETAIAIVLLNW